VTANSNRQSTTDGCYLSRIVLGGYSLDRDTDASVRRIAARDVVDEEAYRLLVAMDGGGRGRRVRTAMLDMSTR